MSSGLSPVVSALLLVLVAVAGSALLYLLVSGFRPAPGGSFSLLKVEGVGLEGGLVAYVRNLGERREVVDAVYVYDSSGRLVWHASGLGLALEPGGLARVPLNASRLRAGERYSIEVAGASGVVASGFSFVFTGGYPVFGVTGYNSSITGPPGGRARLVVTVSNVGLLQGYGQVRVYDHTGSTVNTTGIALGPGSQQTVVLDVVLPASSGTVTSFECLR
ncbi:hypothetical protein IG193_00100 [Infirmifilum lucidum]|uniref:CARDB domain-containing protein n=1 Tax=Infirmifilum lucidum TaxID=2776706 RepID=A0A7L9FJD2_9CREN|nr:hypothetical protein [Infirmifilum lucidum]QOJ78905.1 hypothetical protein IG193_00100 [Infirmifilum lucidum]